MCSSDLCLLALPTTDRIHAAHPARRVSLIKHSLVDKVHSRDLCRAGLLASYTCPFLKYINCTNFSLRKHTDNIMECTTTYTASSLLHTIPSLLTLVRPTALSIARSYLRLHHILRFLTPRHRHGFFKPAIRAPELSTPQAIQTCQIPKTPVALPRPDLGRQRLMDPPGPRKKRARPRVRGARGRGRRP